MNRNHAVAATKMSQLLLMQLRPRLFSTTSHFASRSSIMGPSKIPMDTTIGTARVLAMHARNWSAHASDLGTNKKEDNDQKAVSSYWGIAPPSLTKADGSAWKWNCFRPWEAYEADTSIDMKKHHKPVTWNDKIAFGIVQALKYPTHFYFQKKHIHHAVLLETVAAVPGMVGGMLLHAKSLRRFEQSGGWIKALLEEAENERMHLMTFIDVYRPKWHERALVFAVQGVFFNAYFLAYLASPKLAHRITGYLEEEAVNSYTEFLNDLEKGVMEDMPAPAIAIDYWCLPQNSTMKDVVRVIRADEAHHRDLNHYASDIQCGGHELKEYPAPIGYH
ncbi:ubiquinol oxidase 2, mitochondrial-like [Cynara cardunculus var. scolymus]|uniref:ubiquinol oxidase 2, mitochondrial-like n=1 Tax=Cynara cardunculus var. scolymus TaxID=59895 RepID=UPI000D62A4A0|nr:ubiquinol oxidase 2, mitochondrial-like [Cynara cardunculus var. scolymus]